MFAEADYRGVCIDINAELMGGMGAVMAKACAGAMPSSGLRGLSESDSVALVRNAGTWRPRDAMQD